MLNNGFGPRSDDSATTLKAVGACLLVGTLAALVVEVQAQYYTKKVGERFEASKNRPMNARERDITLDIFREGSGAITNMRGANASTAAHLYLPDEVTK